MVSPTPPATALVATSMRRLAGRDGGATLVGVVPINLGSCGLGTKTRAHVTDIVDQKVFEAGRRPLLADVDAAFVHQVLDIPQQKTGIGRTASPPSG